MDRQNYLARKTFGNPNKNSNNKNFGKTGNGYIPGKDTSDHFKKNKKEK